MAHEHQASRLRALASTKGVSYKFTRHALEEMEKDGISKISVTSALKRCRVEKVEQSGFEETWNAVGSDKDGNKMTVVVVVNEACVRIKVVTAWSMP